MTLLDLLEQLRSMGVVLALSPGGAIHYKAPRGVMTAGLSEAMRTHKAALLDLIGRREDAEIAQIPPALPATAPIAGMITASCAVPLAGHPGV